MMGTKLRDFAPLPNFPLEELVPKGNFYRRLQSAPDLSFVRDLVEDLYTACGRSSVDPVVCFKLHNSSFFRRFTLRSPTDGDRCRPPQYPLVSSGSREDRLPVGKYSQGSARRCRRRWQRFRASGRVLWVAISWATSMFVS
jgi:hypothetical protein